jgi:hypothetical protein
MVSNFVKDSVESVASYVTRSMLMKLQEITMDKRVSTQMKILSEFGTEKHFRLH